MSIALYLKDSRSKPTGKKLDIEAPPFVDYKPDFKAMNRLSKKYSKCKNVIVIGRGGSVTSFEAMYKALGSRKNVTVLDTVSPSVIETLLKEYKKKDTLVITVSKSGNTVDVIEDMLCFEGYKHLVISQGGTLTDIAKKRKYDLLPHPDIGGRFSGCSESGLMPARFVGIDIKKVHKGMQRMWRKCSPKSKDNPALKISETLYKLDNKGYETVFMPIYSPRLSGYIELIMQLIHESSGKKRKGQTFVCALAPECQHHTNQRLFGGKRNMAAMFLRVKNIDDNRMKVKVPKDLEGIKYRNGRLGKISGNSYNHCLDYEFMGTQQNATKLKIPNIVLTMNKITPESIGELIALFHYIAIYSSVLRNVNPYNQPHVEASKIISLQLRRRKNKPKDRYV